MGKYGILGSSFDPITNGHFNTIQEIFERMHFDKIFLMPSSSKRPDKQANVSDEHRLNMIKLAIEGIPYFEIEPFELSVPAHKVHTYETMRSLREMNKYKGHDLWFIMGGDLLRDISEGKHWSNREALLSENKFVVARRNNIDHYQIIADNELLQKYEDHFDFMNWNVDNNISSSYVRRKFDIGHHPRGYLHSNVYQYIKEHQLYGIQPEKGLDF